MRQVRIGLATEGPATKKEFICTDTKAPPINWVCVATFGKDLRCHVRHASRDPREHSPLAKMDGNVEISKMGVAPFVQEDVVRFQITNGESEVMTKVLSGPVGKGDIPMHDFVFVKES